MKIQKILLLLFSLSFLFSCEDEIDVTLKDGKSQLVVDGFINSDSSLQTIRLSLSADYFLNAPTPTVSNASVKVFGPNNTTYNFTYTKDGNFNYDPQTTGALDSVGYPYQLEVIYKGQTYTSISKLPAVPPIDSMTQSYEEASVFSEAGYYTQFFARDFAGKENWYWIKAFKNSENIQESPTDLIFSKDAGFMGAEADGLEFIVPIRASITNSDNPFAPGDTSKVVLLSITEAAYNYLQQAVIQANNGGLFSTPPANLKSNIKDAAGNPQNEVLGVFSVAGKSTQSLIITSNQ